jgi:hypothetical protein
MACNLFKWSNFVYENKIPFELRDADEIVRMAPGEDFIGIVE